MNPGDRIESAIANAANATGISESFLRTVAAQESSFNPKARATTSSATGLFQFIEETWLETMANHGHRHGFAKEAAHITHAKDGRLQIDDLRARQAVLSLRLDPEASALMAGALASDNAARLESHLGRKPDAGEMYMAHVLGVSGAARLIDVVANKPDTPASDLFPAAARANRGLFYDSAGVERDAAGLAQRLIRSFEPGWTPPEVSFDDQQDRDASGGLHSPVLRAALEGRSLEPGAITRPTVQSTSPVLLSSALVEALASLEPPESGADREDARDRRRTQADGR